MGESSPVWSYDDRGYYSMAFIGNCLNNHDYNSYRKYFPGYIFLYTVIVWSYGLPTPRVNSFEFIQQQVLCTKKYDLEKHDILIIRVKNHPMKVNQK